MMFELSEFSQNARPSGSPRTEAPASKTTNQGGSRGRTEPGDHPRDATPSHRQPQRPGPFRAATESLDPEFDPWKRGALSAFDIFALIVNKMVGTGIYTTPAAVFLLTGNKSLTLGLFAVGFVYSLVR